VLIRFRTFKYSITGMFNSYMLECSLIKIILLDWKGSTIPEAWDEHLQWANQELNSDSAAGLIHLVYSYPKILSTASEWIGDWWVTDVKTRIHLIFESDDNQYINCIWMANKLGIQLWHSKRLFQQLARASWKHCWLDRIHQEEFWL